MQEALTLLREWRRDGFPRVDGDGDGKYDSPAIAIFGADDFNLPGETYPRYLWRDLIERTFGDEFGEVPSRYLDQLSRLKVFLDGPRANVPLARDYVDDMTTERRDQAEEPVRASVEHALAELEAEFGTSDMSAWLRPVPTTAFQPLGVAAPPPIQGFDHGTYSQIVDPAAEDGRYILPPGNGSADSALQIATSELGRHPEHFVDQREIYERYGFIEMPHGRAQYTANPESVTRLDYPGG